MTIKQQILILKLQFIYRVNEETQRPSLVAFPLIWYKTAEEEMTSVSDECARRQDKRTALSSTLTRDVNESERVEDDILCNLLSRHGSDVGSGMFRGAGEVVSVQHIDEVETHNSWDKVAASSSSLKSPGIEIPDACDVYRKTFSSSILRASHKQSHAGLKPHTHDR